MANAEKVQTAKAVLRLQSELSRRRLDYFAGFVHPTYTLEWFHRLVYQYLDKWVKGEIPKLAIFVPPQHGKSVMSSITNPAFILGRNPKAKVVCASYNASVSSKFNRLTQDLMLSAEYQMVFPETKLPTPGGEQGNRELRNTSYFETLEHKGFYKSVGVGGALTSETVEYGIIDDPIKDRKEANSPTYRESLWDWYIDVWSTRLNNESREMMLFTRWHEDDLAGRLFDPRNQHYDEKRANKWTVVVIPALREAIKPLIRQAVHYDDPREIGGALWPEKHSKEKHEEDKRLNPYTFASLKQQRPSPLEGGLIKRDWLEVVEPNMLPWLMDETYPPVKFMIDGAFTDKSTNDATAVMAYRVYEGHLYIQNCIPVRYELYEFLKFFVNYANQQEYDQRSQVKIEYKASGPGLVSMLKKPEYGALNVARINDKHVSYGKMTRGEYCTPALASGKVHLIRGSWNEEFIKQCITFPNDLHDDMYDLLCYATLQEVHKAGAQIYKTSVNLGGKII